MRRKRLLILLVAAAILVGGAFSYFHQSAGQPSYPLAGAINLKSISMISSDNGWAVGEISGRPGNILFHYHTGQWTIVKPLPEGTASMPGIATSLESVSMTSKGDGWAIGNESIPEGPPVSNGQSTGMSVQLAGILLHYLNGNWTVVKTYVWARLFQVSMQSATQGWLLGENLSTGETMILHYDGQQWKIMPLPETLAHAYTLALSALNANNIWTAGDNGIVFHYNGKTWTQLHVACEKCRLTALTMLSSNEGWAVGDIFNSDQGIILHYLDGQWITQSDTTTPGLSSVSMLSPTLGWSIGGNGQILHYSNEHWRQVDSPTNQPLSQITMLSVSEGWVVGSTGTILHYQNGSWKLFTNIVYQQAAWDIYKN